jgi:hypothetical protein
MLKQLAVAACLVLPVAAWAQSQQDKMAYCNSEAGAKKLEGDARKKFMSECLSAEHKMPSPAQAAQQEKMTACNKQAGDKGLKGEERQKFMSSCLSAEGAAKKTTSQQDKMTACNKQAGEKKLAGDERKKFMSACLSG